MTPFITPSATLDIVQTFQMDALGVRGRLVRLGPAVDAVLDAHGYPDAVALLLAETLTLAVALASSLKYDGIFTLQAQGDGPISVVVADVTSAGAVRGYARFDADRLADTVEQLQGGAGSVVRLMGAGHLAFTVDQGPDMERYQGITELDGATLSDCAHHYFRNSEQLETAIYLTAQRVGETMRAGALMVQKMPEKTSQISDPEFEEDGWRRTVAILASVGADELLAPDLAPETLIYRLYHEDEVRAYPPQTLVQKCRCSREKVATTLGSFPRDEVIDETGSARVVCEFCKADYRFSVAQLDGLFVKTAADGS